MGLIKNHPLENIDLIEQAEIISQIKKFAPIIGAFYDEVLKQLVITTKDITKAKYSGFIFKVKKNYYQFKHINTMIAVYDIDFSIHAIGDSSTIEWIDLQIDADDLNNNGLLKTLRIAYADWKPDIQTKRKLINS